MNPRIQISPAAQADIDDAAEYIAQDRFEAGVRFLVAVNQAFEDLLTHPRLGRVREFSHRQARDLRSWRIRGFENWLIFYRLLEEGIEVVRVLHGARELEGLLEQEAE